MLFLEHLMMNIIYIVFLLLLKMLYNYYTEKRADGSFHETRLPEKQIRLAGGHIPLAAVDYISGLTDNFAINLFEDIFVPRYWTFKKE